MTTGRINQVTTFQKEKRNGKNKKKISLFLIFPYLSSFILGQELELRVSLIVTHYNSIFFLQKLLTNVKPMECNVNDFPCFCFASVKSQTKARKSAQSIQALTCRLVPYKVSLVTGQCEYCKDLQCRFVFIFSCKRREENEN